MLRSFLPSVHGRTGWSIFSVVLLVFAVAVPVLNQSMPPGSPLHVPDHWIPLLGKFACYAIAALAVDLVWGYAGILTLGHALFFALGGYAMGMYLMLSIGEQGVYRSNLPDFMVFLNWKELPWFWQGFDHFGFAVFMAAFVPASLAFVFGYLAFRSRIRGVYFSIITQALTYAMMLLFFRNETGFGGNNGLTDFKVIYGYPIQAPSTKLALYLISVGVLALLYVLSRAAMAGRFGRTLRAIRDVESKVRFSGYDSLRYKLVAWTASAALCGIAGALYVPQVGIINPSEMEPANSIEMVIWVAVGGRGTLFGPLVGAFVVNAAKSWFTVAAPQFWLFILGGLFVVVTLALPDGLVSLGRTVGRGLRGRVRRTGSSSTPETNPASTPK